jgi:hypothetical protein
MSRTVSSLSCILASREIASLATRSMICVTLVFLEGPLLPLPATAALSRGPVSLLSSSGPAAAPSHSPVLIDLMEHRASFLLSRRRY